MFAIGVSVFCMILIFVNVGASSFSKQAADEEQLYIVSPWKAFSPDISVYSGVQMKRSIVFFQQCLE